MPLHVVSETAACAALAGFLARARDVALPAEPLAHVAVLHASLPAEDATARRARKVRRREQAAPSATVSTSRVKRRRTLGSVSLLLLLSLLTAQPARADCAFRQDCIPTGADVCRPRPVGPNETLPFALPGQPFYACPQFQGSTCCTAQQNRLLYVNLLQIQALFGDERDGGCPGCYFNMHNFWCEYTCFPRQADFVSVLGAANVTDPENPGRLVEVLRTEVRLARDFGCDLYSSCQSVKSVTETSAMSNAEGFFAYQGQYEAIQHGAFIEFDLNPAQGNASCNRSSNGGGPCQGAMFIA